MEVGGRGFSTKIEAGAEGLFNSDPVCELSRFSRVRLLTMLWTVTQQAPLSMGLSRQEYWSG